MSVCSNEALETRLLALLTDEVREDLTKGDVKHLVAIDIMDFLRKKKSDYYTVQRNYLDLEVKDGVEQVVWREDTILVIASGFSHFELPCNLRMTEGLMVFAFVHRAIGYHTLLAMCDVIEIPYGVMTPIGSQSWED